jgi:hypothetical protein
MRAPFFTDGPLAKMRRNHVRGVVFHPASVHVELSQVSTLPKDAESRSDVLKLFIDEHVSVLMPQRALPAVRSLRELAADPR